MASVVSALAGLYLVGYSIVSGVAAVKVGQFKDTEFRTSPFIWFANVIVNKFAKKTQKRVKLIRRVLIANSVVSMLIGLWTFVINAF